MPALSIRNIIWNPTDPIDRVNCNRGIESFTHNECWHFFRFRKDDLARLLIALNLPNFLEVKGTKNGFCSSEYALLYLLHRLHYPENLNGCQKLFGRDYTQLGKNFNTILDIMYELHRNKILCNLYWYSDRFDLYHEAYQRKIAELNDGIIPGELNNIFGNIDGHAKAIGKTVHDNPFWNR